LGSATPSLESFCNARAGKYELLQLPARVDHRPLPPVRVVDMRQEVWDRHGQHALSRALEREMRAALDAGRQVILFLNRRGHSPHISCRRCGFVLKCHRCDIALTYHRGYEMAICHYCNGEAPAPQQCPDCGAPNVRYWGIGTQKVEEEVREKFPNAAVARMDSDTTRGRGSHDRILSAFLDGKVQVLLGTQMIAKGLDFPNVTVVGVISPDVGLALPDFRATERTFQLVAQVAGRTGRGEHGGVVVVQTSLPDHYCIEYASRHDYWQFAKHELEARRPLSYPPFARMVRLVLTGRRQEEVQEAGRRIADALRVRAPQGQAWVVGPAPAPIAQIRHMFRWHILVRSPKSSVLHEMIAEAEREIAGARPVKVAVDFDPVSML
jgi:primosomal protein N' (replication factor Y)